MKKIYLSLVLLPLLATAQAQPVISVAGSPCANNTLTVTSNIKPARIVWKLNGTTVQTVNATWNPNGITVAGGNGAGPALNQIDQPSYLYVDTFGNVFVADYNNNRVMKWGPGATTGVVVAGNNGAGSNLNQTYGPSGLWLDPTGNIFVSEYLNARVTEWAQGGTTGTLVAGSATPGSGEDQLDAVQGIYVDNNDTVYIADFNNNRIQKWAPGAATGTTVAGGNGNGAASNQLSAPEGVFVDKNKNVFAADFTNFRIQEWMAGADTGITVAGGNGNGNGDNQTFPDDVFVDGLGNMYVSSIDNSYRIQQWAPGASTGTNIAGGNGYGTADNQFEVNIALFLDDSGNVYVSDLENNRVQKFLSTIVDTFAVTATGSYTVTVYSFNGDSTTQSINPAVPATVITASPGVAISQGENVTFSSTATNGGATPTYQWYINGQAINGATNSTYSSSTLVNNDTITLVMHSNAACVYPDTAISDTLVMTVSTGISQINMANAAISLYPNPNNGSFTLQGTCSGDKTISAEIINMVGQVIYSDVIPVGNNTLNKKISLNSNTAGGVYMLRIKTSMGSSTTQFVISH